GSEREELRGFCKLLRDEGCTRNLDHRTDEIGDLNALLFHHLCSNAACHLCGELQLFHRADEGDHHFGIDVEAFPFHVTRCLKDRAQLHLVDFRICNAEAASAMD